jgi:murein L,D-transpeptidase YafK
MKTKLVHITGIALVGATLLAACAMQETPPHMRPLSKDAMMLLGRKGMKTEAPIFIRIFKEESELEVWKARDDGHFYHFKTYPICTWSGELGPKLAQGDKQAPEGFYTIHKNQMNPNSSFHLAFNLGFPNAFDKAHKRTGSALMVHGKCRSAGCYAMTDALIEEIYALAREQFAAGHETFQVHAYPFRMTAENLARHKGSRWHPFWLTLKEGYDHFETTRQPPPVSVCERRYHVNARPLQNASMRLDPEARCPVLDRPKIEPFRPTGSEQVAERQIIAPGVKMRDVASQQGSGASDPGFLSGLTRSAPARSPSLGFGGD